MVSEEVGDERLAASLLPTLPRTHLPREPAVLELSPPFSSAEPWLSTDWARLRTRLHAERVMRRGSDHGEDDGGASSAPTPHLPQSNSTHPHGPHATHPLGRGGRPSRPAGAPLVRVGPAATARWRRTASLEMATWGAGEVAVSAMDR